MHLTWGSGAWPGPLAHGRYGPVMLAVALFGKPLAERQASALGGQHRRLASCSLVKTADDARRDDNGLWCSRAPAAEAAGAEGSAVGQQAGGQALDVAGLADGRVHRVIGALGAALKQLDGAVQMAGAGQQDVLQMVFFQVHRATGADQNAVLGQQAHRRFVEATVGGLAVLDVLLALDEGG